MVRSLASGVFITRRDPYLCNGARQKRCFADLAPTDRGLAVGDDNFLQAFDEIFVLPFGCGTRFIAADVNVGSGCERGKLADHIIQELICDFIVDPQCAEADLGPFI